MSEKSEITVFTNTIRGNDSIELEQVFSRTKGLVVYQNNYLYGHISALERKFTSIVKALGHENFNYFARLFIIKNPSKSENIDNYGFRFESFLAEQNELLEMGYLKYLARLDLFWFESFKNLGKSIGLPKGIFSLWDSLINEKEIDEIEIVEQFNEKIIMMKEEEEILLVLIDNEHTGEIYE